MESSADIHIQLHLDANGKLDINLVDLSIQESVVQMDAERKVKAEN